MPKSKNKEKHKSNKEKKHENNEKLSDKDLRELMGSNNRGLKRGPGGAWRNG